jgi:hypothetical protein
MTNGHRSSAFSYVKKNLQSFQDQFFSLETKDSSAFLTIEDARHFRQTIASETDLINYNHQLAFQTGQQMSLL